MLLVQRCLGGKAVGNVDGHLGSPFRNQCENRAKISIYAEKGIKVVRTYREPATEGSHAHHWEFWNLAIRKVIDWLDLGPATHGVDSGAIAGSSVGVW